MRKNSIQVVIALATVLFLVAPLGVAGPDEPKGTNLYYLEIEVKDPRGITVVTAEGEEVFTYFRYKVKNPTTRKIYFCPRIELVTENKDVYKEIIDPFAAKAIEKRLGKKLPAGVAASGDLPAGEDRKGIAIFKGVSKKADRLYLRIGGLTNEFFLDKTDAKAKAVFKTYQIQYRRPGDEFDRHMDQLHKGISKWVWENEPPE